MDTDTAPPTAPARRFPRPVGTQRTLQVVLGMFWLLDAGLQFQPFMFGNGFTTTYLLNNAHGQPTAMGWVITNVGHFLVPHIAVWNTLFALLQVTIGAGLLFRRTVRPALALSFLWAASVWFFGEGLGQLLTGAASALTGAPGSVLLYALVGLMAWPRAPRADDAARSPTGLASSAAARGIGGAVTPLVVWSGFWSLAAVLFIMPDNRTQTSVMSAIVGMSPGEPGGYSHFLSSVGNHFGSVGVQSTWLLAIAALVIGIGPLVARRPGGYLLAGALLSALFWVTGQGLGGIFTGSGTDPNSGPLVVLLALAMMPATAEDPSTWRSPLARLVSRAPLPAFGGAALLGLSLFLSAAYPVSARESTTTAMAGMPGMGGPDGSPSTGVSAVTAKTASCSAGNNFAPRTGLDVTNTPNMLMTGHLGMNMNGSDANAAAGLNTTKSNWYYTGPALPQAMAQELLAQGGNGNGDIHMAVSGCAREPTFSQEIHAVQYVQATSQAAARYASPFQAVTAGFVAVSPTDYPVTYYVNPLVMAGNEAARRTLDPAHVDGLLYATTPSGAEVLAAAMYVLPSSVQKVPMPYGPLVQWHARADVCGSATASAQTPFAITGVVPCGPGTVHRNTPYVTMVWQIPVSGGPLAIQPQDIQIVEASVMATTGTLP